MALPRGAMGLSAVCNCGISLSYSLFLIIEFFIAIFWDPGLQIRVHIGQLFSLFLLQNICCGYSKEPSRDGSLEHSKHMLHLMGEELITILSS